MFTRLYTSLSSNALKSSKKCNLYLSYLKLRTIASNKAGRFYLKEAVEVLGLSERTTKKHLSNLPEVIKTKTGYRLSNPIKIPSTYTLISKEQLFSYNWKNIASFHSYLSEVELSRYKRHQEAKVRGYKVFNSKDKIYERVQDGRNSYRM